jgi:membrane peptidoglycan carboxypeptidase
MDSAAPPYPGRVAASPSPDDTVLTKVGIGLLLSIVMGVLMAGVAFPLVGGVGLMAKSGADDFLALPADLQTGPPPQRSKILAADGSLLATLYLQNRVNVPLASVPLETRQAIIAIEDARFYAHHGVDVKGILRAAATNAGSGGVKQGASTLTQQYVKNALIEAASDKKGQRAATADSLDRKLREARYAMALEHQLTKDQILERYLNIAYYGHGVYGVGTAANYYFGKPVSRLSLAESATLAGMVKNPNTYDPSSRDPKVREITKARRDTVLARMADLGFITPELKARAEATPLFTRLRPVESGCENPAVRSPFFCDYVRRELEDTPVGAVLGATREERKRKLLGGGLTIRTSLDPRIQGVAQQAVNERVPPNDKFGAAAAIDTVEPGTGLIRAMAVDRPYAGDFARSTKVNYATGGVYGFQAGSTFKAFVLAEALRQGIPLDLRLHAPQKYTSKIFKNVEKGKVEAYTVENAGDSEAGTFDMTEATHLSVNTYFMQLEERTGVDKPAALAEAMGVHRVKNQVADQPLQRVPSFVLGTNGVSPLEMAAAYATFAAHGMHCPPRAVTEILGPEGEQMTLPPNDCQQVLEPGVADTVTSVLRGVIDGPEHLRTGAHASIGRPAAGKTGTVNESKAAWFVGYTPQLATAVWVGKSTPAPMKNVVINGRFYKQVYGGSIPAEIWKQAMSAAHEGLPVQDFAKADPEVVNGAEVAVPDVTALGYEAAKAALTAAGFGVRGGGLVDGGPIPFGSVAYTSPRAGEQVAPGTTVTIYVSNGRVPATPVQPSPEPSPAFSPPPPSPAPPLQPSPKPTKRRRGG